MLLIGSIARLLFKKLSKRLDDFIIKLAIIKAKMDSLLAQIEQKRSTNKKTVKSDPNKAFVDLKRVWEVQ